MIGIVLGTVEGMTSIAAATTASAADVSYGEEKEGETDGNE